MNRHAQAVMAALVFVVAGCAHDRAASAAPEPFVPIEPNPPEAVRASINQGKIPSDLSTVRASYEPVDEPRGKPAQVAPVVPQAKAKPSDPPKSATVDRPKAAQDDPSMSLRTDPDLPPGKPASRAAAVVGDTIISYRELRAAVCQRMEMKPHELANLPEEQHKLVNQLAKDTLDTLIDRTLILQEGRRDIRKEQQWNMFVDFFEKNWREKELTSLMKKSGVEDEISLRKKLDESGESLDDLKEAWKMEAMSRELLMMRVQPKVTKPNLPEMEDYYAKHRTDPKFRRDAKVRWREILVPVDKPADLAAARQKAGTLRAQLLSGADFAKMAKTSSGGVTAAKGGFWETTPDGNAVPAINVALAKLSPGQISAPIEGLKGIHLIRVEARREAGIASFTEVQREIAEAIFQERFSDAISAYIKKLRDKTTISSPMFEGTTSAPTVVDERAKTDTQAKRASTR